MSVDDVGCVFCGIVSGALPSTQVYADGQIVAIQDLRPQAPVHMLVLPRRHISGIATADAEDGVLLTHLVAAANRVARDAGIAASGYRLVINQGTDGGQTVGHLHIHVVGGRQMHWPPG